MSAEEVRQAFEKKLSGSAYTDAVVANALGDLGSRPGDDDAIAQAKWDETRDNIDRWRTAWERVNETELLEQLVDSGKQQIVAGLLNGEGTAQEVLDRAEQMLDSPAVLWGLSNHVGEERAQRGIAAIVSDVRSTVNRWFGTGGPTQSETKVWSAPVSLDIPVLPPLPPVFFQPGSTIWSRQPPSPPRRRVSYQR
jgi:hypothetical protein